MPQVDYNDIPYNGTTESRRTSGNDNYTNRLNTIIEELTTPRQHQRESISDIRGNGSTELRESVNLNDIKEIIEMLFKRIVSYMK